MLNFKDFLASTPKLDETKTVTIIFGTGVSKALSSHTAADWPGQIRFLADCLPATVKDALDVEKVLKVAKSHHYTGLLHMIRRELGARWESKLTHCIKQVIESPHPTGKPAVAEWTQVLAEIGDLVREGRVRVASTNFDDMIAKACKLKVITRRGDVYDPEVMDSTNPQLLIEPPLPPGEEHRKYALTDENRFTLRAWGDTHQRTSPLWKDILQRTAGVLHLHGWYRLPNDLVIDPVDYHLAVERAIGEDLAASLIESSLRRPDTITLLVGVGEGLLDDHFIQIFKSLIRTHFDYRSIKELGLSLPTLAEQNLWLLQEDQDKAKPDLLSEVLREHGIQHPDTKLVTCEDLVKVVGYEKDGTGDAFALAPHSLRSILTHYL